MKLATLTHEVETNIPQSQQSEMRILHNSKMFEMLAGLYSDVPKAIWRELIANADDANKSVGATRPFQVAMPSATRRAISIRDFGPGMTKQFMLNGYTWVGHSTKAESNDDIGGFGLGRLAPIAYPGSQSYTVISINEGMKRVYAVYKNSKSIPTVGLTHEEPTDEPSGCEIMVPIRREDYDLFEQKLQEVLRWFPVGSYEVFGARIEPVKYNLRRPTYFEIERGERVNHALMGPIAYQIDWGQIGVELPTSIVPVFEIGELDLPPSREQVSYSPITLAAMRKRYQEIVDTLPREALREAQTMTPVQRLRFVENLRYSRLSEVFENYHKKAGHRAKDKAAEAEHRRKTGNIIGFEPKWGRFLLYRHEHIIVEGSFTTYDRSSRGYSAINKKSVRHTHQLVFTHTHQLHGVIYYFNDVVDQHHPRIADRIMASGKYAPRGYVVVHDRAAWDQLKTILDGDVFFNLSEFDPPPTTRSRARTIFQVSNAGSTNFEEATGLLPTEGIWIPYDGKDIDNSEAPFWSLRQLPWARDVVVYGFNKTVQRKVDLDDFERLDHYILRKAKAALGAENIRQHLSAAEILRQAEEKPLYGVARQRLDLGRRDLLSDVIQRLERVRQDNVALDDVVSLRGLAKLGLVKLPEARDYHRLLPALDRAEKKNPQLMLLYRVYTHEIYNPFTSNNPDVEATLKQMVKK